MDQHEVINVLSLCSGGGGLELGVEIAVGGATRTICYVEREAFAIAYLASRMEAGCLDQAPIWSDIRTFDGRPWRGIVDIVTAGYPCQPHSVAGKRRGQDDHRNLWPEVRRIVEEVEPSIVFFENVSGHISSGFRCVLEDLEGMGFRASAGLYGANEVGASMERKRVFIIGIQESALANRDPSRLQNAYLESLQGQEVDRKKAGRSERDALELRRSLFPPCPSDEDEWIRIAQESERSFPAIEPGVCGVVDGLAKDRANWIRLFGNGVVPLQASYAFCSLWAAVRYREYGEEAS